MAISRSNWNARETALITIARLCRGTVVRVRKLISLEMLACIAVALVTCCSTGASKSVNDTQPAEQLTGPQLSLTDQPGGIALDSLVVFQDPVVEFIVGPQLKIPNEENPHKWFDETQVKNGGRHAREFPAFPPGVLTGSVSVDTKSRTVIGIGTRFTSEVNPKDPAPFFNGRLRIREADGVTFRQVQVLSVQSDTEMTLTAPWAYASQKNALADTLYNDGNGWNSDIYINLNYYDLGLCLYGLYYRTNDPKYLADARKIADSWWKSPHIKEGTIRTFDTFTHTPRNSSLGGLILRALDGRPEMWDWINAYTRYQFDVWLKSRIKNPQLYLGVRDGAFMLQYATWLAKALPDTFPRQTSGGAVNGTPLRAQYLADVEAIATQYFGRLQYPDGSWRWDDPYGTDADGGTLKGIMQPFMVGLLLQALVDVHRLTTNSSVKSNIQSQITKACQHLFTGPYRRNDSTGISNTKWRSFWYLYHGGTTVNPSKYQHGGGSAKTANAVWEVKSERQGISTVLPAFGYAYKVTGDSVYREMGEELFDAAFGKSDGVRNEADGTAKNYNQNYRSAGRYLFWRLPIEASRPRRANKAED